MLASFFGCLKGYCHFYIGQRVCIFGAKSAFRCGTVIDPTYTFLNLQNQVIIIILKLLELLSVICQIMVTVVYQSDTVE